MELRNPHAGYGHHIGRERVKSRGHRRCPCRNLPAHKRAEVAWAVGFAQKGYRNGPLPRSLYIDNNYEVVANLYSAQY